MALIAGLGLAAGVADTVGRSYAASKQRRRLKRLRRVQGARERQAQSEQRRLLTINKDLLTQAAARARAEIAAGKAGGKADALAAGVQAQGSLAATLAGGGQLGSSAGLAASRGIAADVSRSLLAVDAAFASMSAQNELNAAQLEAGGNAALASFEDQAAGNLNLLTEGAIQDELDAIDDPGIDFAALGSGLQKLFGGVKPSFAANAKKSLGKTLSSFGKSSFGNPLGATAYGLGQLLLK